MRSHPNLRNLVLVLVSVSMLLTTAGPLSAQVPANPLCGALPLDPLGGCMVWEDTFDGGSDDGPTEVAVSPDGSMVFVTGFSYARPPGSGTYDYVTVAYDAATGLRAWTVDYEGRDAAGDPARGQDFAMALTVSPDGDTVYVTGGSFGYDAVTGGTGQGVVTLAYEASTGALLWEARYHGIVDPSDMGRDVETSADGTKLYVSATLSGTPLQNVGVLTYEAATGTLLAADVYDGPGGRGDSVFFRSLAVSSTGDVFVAAQSYVTGTGYDYALLRYDADGTRLGATYWDGGEGNVERPFGVDVSPDGDAVYVTGQSRTSATGYDMATVAFGTDGMVLWSVRHDEAGTGASDQGYVVEASADGAFVAVTGSAVSTSGDYGYVTAVYEAGSGAERWVQRHDGGAGANDQARGLVIDPDSEAVYVTGHALEGAGSDIVTLAYDAVTGLELWRHAFAGVAQGDDLGRSIVADPAGGRVYVTGDTYAGTLASYDIATFALSAPGPGLPLPEPPL